MAEAMSETSMQEITPQAQAGGTAVSGLDDYVVVARNLSRRYRKGSEIVHAVREASLEIPRGHLVALMGRSGSGKTTLLNLIGGLDRPDTGEVYIEGRNILRLSDDALTKLRRHRIGFVFQTFALLPVLSAYENVELPLRIAGVGARERHNRVMECLAMVGLTKRAGHRPFELSGGEQQRVGIARALVNRPALILADEPTGELDSVTGLQIMRIFKRIVDEEGVTVIMATHDPTIRQLATINFQMADGRLTRVS